MIGKAALGVSIFALLMVVIGLALPLNTYEKGSVKASYGVKDHTVEMGSTKTTTDSWDFDCGSNDECKEAKSLSQTCFAFCFIGLLVNLVLIAALSAANFPEVALLQKMPPQLRQKMPIVGVAGGLSVCYLIGMACGIAAARRGTLKDDMEVGAGGALLIIGWLGALASVALSFVGIGEMVVFPAGPAGGDVEAPATVPPAEAAPPAVEAAPAADAANPPADGAADAAKSE